MIEWIIDLQINSFYFFKSSEKFVEKTEVTKSFLVRKNNISHSVNILREKVKIHA